MYVIFVIIIFIFLFATIGIIVITCLALIQELNGVVYFSNIQEYITLIQTCSDIILGVFMMFLFVNKVYNVMIDQMRDDNNMATELLNKTQLSLELDYKLTTPPPDTYDNSLHLRWAI